MARRLLATYLTITALALAVVIVPLGRVFADREHDRLVFDIERDAQAVASLVEDDLEERRAPDVRQVLEDYAEGGGRIVVVDRAGISVADSEPLDRPRDFSTRPEIIAALDGDRTSGTRDSETLGTGLVFVAVPVASGGRVHGAVRVTYPTSKLDARVRSTWLRLGGLALVVLALVAVVGMAFARGVTRPVRRLEHASHRLADGDLDARVPTDDGPPELRALAETFNSTAERLAQLVESQRRFVADASHQLRTPLTALRLRLETLEPTLPPDTRPKVAAALVETERLTRLVSSLLVLARTDASRPEPVTVDVASVVRERVESWRPVAAEQGVRLTAQAPPALLVVAVPGAIEQVLDNLLSNALDVAPEATEVAVSITVDDGRAALHVRDEGPGMLPEARQRAFERFWRPPGASGEGFGLGLAIVDQLARASGGDVRLDAGPDGVGLDVVVRFATVAPDLPDDKDLDLPLT